MKKGRKKIQEGNSSSPKNPNNEKYNTFEEVLILFFFIYLAKIMRVAHIYIAVRYFFELLLFIACSPHWKEGKGWK